MAEIKPAILQAVGRNDPRATRAGKFPWLARLQAWADTRSPRDLNAPAHRAAPCGPSCWSPLYSAFFAVASSPLSYLSHVKRERGEGRVW